MTLIYLTLEVNFFAGTHPHETGEFPKEDKSLHTAVVSEVVSEPTVKNLPLKMRIRISRISEQEVEKQRTWGVTDDSHDDTGEAGRKCRRSKSLLEGVGNRDIIVGSLVPTETEESQVAEAAATDVAEEAQAVQDRGRKSRKAKRLASATGAVVPEPADEATGGLGSGAIPSTRSRRGRTLTQVHHGEDVAAAAAIEGGELPHDKGEVEEPKRASRSRNRRVKASSDTKAEGAAPEAEAKPVSGEEQASKSDRRSHKARGTARNQSGLRTGESTVTEGSAAESVEKTAAPKPSRTSRSRAKTQQRGKRAAAKTEAAVPESTETEPGNEFSAAQPEKRERRTRRSLAARAEEPNKPEVAKETTTDEARDGDNLTTRPTRKRRAVLEDLSSESPVEESEVIAKEIGTVYELPDDADSNTLTDTSRKTRRAKPAPTERGEETADAPRKAESSPQRPTRAQRATRRALLAEQPPPSVLAQAEPPVGEPAQPPPAEERVPDSVPDSAQSGDTAAETGPVDSDKMKSEASAAKLGEEESSAVTGGGAQVSEKPALPSKRRAPSRKKGSRARQTRARKAPPPKPQVASASAVENGDANVESVEPDIGVGETKIVATDEQTEKPVPSASGDTFPSVSETVVSVSDRSDVAGKSDVIGSGDTGSAVSEKCEVTCADSSTAVTDKSAVSTSEDTRATAPQDSGSADDCSAISKAEDIGSRSIESSETKSGENIAVESSGVKSSDSTTAPDHAPESAKNIDASDPSGSTANRAATSTVSVLTNADSSDAKLTEAQEKEPGVIRHTSGAQNSSQVPVQDEENVGAQAPTEIPTGDSSKRQEPSRNAAHDEGEKSGGSAHESRSAETITASEADRTSASTAEQAHAVAPESSKETSTVEAEKTDSVGSSACPPSADASARVPPPSEPSPQKDSPDVKNDGAPMDGEDKAATTSISHPS